MQIFLPISEKVWSSDQDVWILKLNMVSISVAFEITALTDPRGQLPLGNAEWPKSRFPSRTYVLLSGEVVFLSGKSSAFTSQRDHLGGMWQKRWSKLQPAKLLGAALTRRPWWPSLWVLVYRPPSRAGLTLAQPFSMWGREAEVPKLHHAGQKAEMTAFPFPREHSGTFWPFCSKPLCLSRSLVLHFSSMKTPPKFWVHSTQNK